MPINRTTLLDLPLPVTGTESGTWGDITNKGLTEYLDIAIAGMSNLTSANFTAGALTIETTEGDASATNISATSAQYAGFRVSSLATNSTITVGNTGSTLGRSYRLINADSTYTLTFKATGQTGVTLQPGQSAVVAFNGTDYVFVGSVGPLSFATPLTVVGNATAGSEIRLPEDTDNGSNYVALKAADSLAANVTFTLPNADGSNGQLIQTNGSGTLSFVTGAVAANFQEFTSSGTWTKPTGATFVMVEAWGAGGGGGSGCRGGASNTRQGGSGGGGGAYAYRLFKASDLGSTETVTIGAGGAGGAAVTVDNTNGNAGTNGGDTTFGSWLSAFGGGNGAGGQISSGGNVNGGGGGGVLSAGSSSNAGQPGSRTPDSSSTNVWGQFGGGMFPSGLASNAAALPSGFGGGQGGGNNSIGSTVDGGCSYQGGPGGGSGGALSNANANVAASAGGTVVGTSGGGGTAGTAPATATSNGGNGGTGTVRIGGGGGANGGSTSGTGGTGGAGFQGGGGGGGGASVNGSNSGAGGAGGAGLVRVYTW